MGNCCCCCCAGPPADPSDPDVAAHILTDQFVRYRGIVIITRYVLPGSPKAVYVRDGGLYFDCCAGCIGGYPLQNITSAEVVRGVTLQLPRSNNRSYYPRRVDYSGFHLNPGVHITGSDGTIIAFLGKEGELEKFVQDLSVAMKTASVTDEEKKIPKLSDF